MQRSDLHFRTEETLFGTLVTSRNAIELTTYSSKKLQQNLLSKRKIIITYIPAQVTAEELRKLCENQGELVDFQLVIHKSTGERKGYAFAEYREEAGARKACEELNGLVMRNKRIKVCPARPRDDGIKKSNIHVSGLPRNWTMEDFFRFFRPFGTVISAKLLRDPVTGRNRGVGFVRYSTHIEAVNTMDLLDGLIPEEEVNPLTITFAQANGPHRPWQPDFSGTSFSPDDGENQQPSASNAAPSSGRDRRQPASFSNVAAGVWKKNPSIPPGPLPAKLFESLEDFDSPKRFGTWALFVGNLGRRQDEKFLKELFGKYGEVESVKIMQRGKYDGGGFGFVNMHKADAAILAHTNLNGYKVGENHRLVVAFKSNRWYS